MKLETKSTVIITVVVAFFSFVLAGNAIGQDITGKLGLGYQGMLAGDFVQGISARYWASEKAGIEGNIFHAYASLDTGDDDDSVDGHALGFLGKVLYAPVVKDNSRFYVGLEAGYGVITSDEADEDLDIFIVGPLFGAEYSFQGLPELGFNFEVGYKLTNFSIDDVDLDIAGVGVSFGIHYYF